MSLSNLYFKGCFEPLSQDQADAVEELGVESELVDKGCLRRELNTCGLSIQELFDTYEIYSTQKGLYRTWGEIEFPWEISNLTPDLFFTLTDDKWSVGSYRKIAAYPEGARVLLIGDDGYEVGLYEANQDILSISGPFDFQKWTKICSVKTSIPIGLPSVQDLLDRFRFYSLSLFYDEWDEVDSEWSEDAYEVSLQNCQAIGGSLADFEKCMRNTDSNTWGNVKIRKQFFYRRGDVVLVEGECGDVICVWTAIQDMPASQAIYDEYKKFQPGPYWQKTYCVSMGEGVNKCLDYQRKKEPSLGYDVVQIGSQGHYVEVPVPYRLKPKTPSLTEIVQVRNPPAVLTQEQIDALTQPEEE